ncbi:hypothetical protein [Nitratireductor aquimarinus]|uniref:hypothetical protein n=1 Tax=Nitratireductor aquimarinus TaxID=889300 RepID=UPI003B5A8E2F
MAAIASTELSRLADYFRQHSQSGVCLPPAVTAQLAEQLRLIADLTASQEQELRVHRLGECERLGREIMDSEADEALRGLVTDPCGVVIRPDFGRKS